MWHRQKIKDLISKNHSPLNKIDFWVNEIKKHFLEIDQLLKKGQNKLAYLIIHHLYDNVPKNIRKKVADRVETLIK